MNSKTKLGQSYFMKVSIDTKSERKRLQNKAFTKKERIKLLELCDLIDNGRIYEAAERVCKFSKEEKEMIGWEIFQVLRDAANGECFIFIKCPV